MKKIIMWVYGILIMTVIATAVTLRDIDVKSITKDYFDSSGDDESKVLDDYAERMIMRNRMMEFNELTNQCELDVNCMEYFIGELRNYLK